MALFTDQFISEVSDLTAYESNLPEMMASLNKHVVLQGFNALTTAAVLSYHHDLTPPWAKAIY